MTDETITFSAETCRALDVLINNVIVNQAVAIEDARAYIAALSQDVAGTEADFALYDPDHVAAMGMKAMQVLKGDSLIHGAAVRRYGEDLRASFSFAESERRESWLASPRGPKP
jgi:hypothetical protein